jgi:hypothetical protein
VCSRHKAFISCLQIVIDNARSDYDLALKAANQKGDTLPPFVPGDVDLSHILPGGTFVVGFTFASAPDMAQVRAGGINKVLQADAAHVAFGGCLLRLVGSDSGRHTVPVLSKWSAQNESTQTWAKLGNEAVQLYGDAINNAAMGAISDRDKGLISGLFGALDRVADTACHTHLKVDVGKHCGPAAVKPFVAMAFAPTVDRFQRLKSKAPLRLLAYLEPMEECKWAKSMHRVCMEGRMSSSVRKHAQYGGYYSFVVYEQYLITCAPLCAPQAIEGLNGADAASRGGFRGAKDASDLLLKLTEAYQRRQIRRANEAQNAVAGSIPPRVRRHLEQKLERFEAEAVVAVKFQDSPHKKRGAVSVGYAIRPFTLGSYEEAACSCGSKEVDGEPCGCLLLAAKASGFDIANLLHERDTAVNWTRQYTGLPDFKIPGTEEIDACPADNFLVAAAAYPVPRGRPSTKRKKGAIDFWEKKAKRARLQKPLKEE